MIHTFKNALKMADSTYLYYLFETFGVTSSKDLNFIQGEGFMLFLKMKRYRPESGTMLIRKKKSIKNLKVGRGMLPLLNWHLSKIYGDRFQEQSRKYVPKP